MHVSRNIEANSSWIAKKLHGNPGENMCLEVPGDAVQPPPLRRMPGRPRKNRMREEDEGAAATSIIE